VSVYAKLYDEAPKGTYTVNIEWQDSVLSDTNEELNHRLQLKNAGVLSDVELRMWFTGEDEKTAQAAIDKIKQTQLEDAQANAEAMGSANNSDNPDKGVKKTERDNDRTEANQKKEEKQIKDAKPQDK
jgi:hypothetical protein